MKKIITVTASIFTVLTIGTTAIFNTFQSVPLNLAVAALSAPLATDQLFRITNPAVLSSLAKFIPGASKLLSGGAHKVILPAAAKTFGTGAKIAFGAAGVAAIAAFIVIEYQIAEINHKLDNISDQLSKISDFQNREFKSRILSLHTKVKDTTKFSGEILENEDVRLRKLAVLESLESEGTQLLQQINLTLEEEVSKNNQPDFETYSTLTSDFDTLIEQQSSLISTLETMSELTYLFERGAVSSEMCYSIFETYYDQSVNARNTLTDWHQQQIQNFGIDFENNTFDKQGLAAIISKIPGAFDDSWNHEELTTNLIEQIQEQTAAQPFASFEPENTLAEDLSIIIQDGEYYYQPAS